MVQIAYILPISTNLSDDEGKNVLLKEIGPSKV